MLRLLRPKAYRRPSRWPRRVMWVAVVIISLAAVSVIAVRHVYSDNLRPLDNNPRTYNVVIASGTSDSQIATRLKTAGLIRSSWAFEWYVRSNDLHSKLQAGTYAFSSSQSIPQIVHMLVIGKIVTNLVIILPGQTLAQIRDTFLNAKFAKPAVDAAFNPAAYTGIPALADKPASASLEGFLYPDSYQKDANTDPSVIVREALQEMDKHLTPDIRTSFAREGLSVYQGVTLASIVEKEVASPGDRAQVAQVFLKRLQMGMPLGSDVTAIYARSVHDPRYDTTVNTGLPPGPISNVSDTSLQAVAHPAATDWLYFVSGDNGTTYFSHTLAEHQALTQQYCHKLCSSSP